jgi:hypothetical protein
MTHSPESSERAMSASPAGTWLECLRSGFEPESEKKAKPTLAAALLGGRLRQA